MVQGGNIYVVENSNGSSPVSTYTAEDALRIERLGTTINYLKNGGVFYTTRSKCLRFMTFRKITSSV
jgi:hypothetical protein